MIDIFDAITRSNFILTTFLCSLPSSPRLSSTVAVMIHNIVLSSSWSCYYWFLPFLVLAANCLYIGLSNHQIYIFLNFVSLLLLVVSSLLVLRVLCLSFLLALIYSGAVVITFIFVVMTFDQSEILCIPSYKFIPVLVLYIEGFTPQLAYSILQDSLADVNVDSIYQGVVPFFTSFVPLFAS